LWKKQEGGQALGLYCVAASASAGQGQGQGSWLSRPGTGGEGFGGQRLRGSGREEGEQNRGEERRGEREKERVQGEGRGAKVERVRGEGRGTKGVCFHTYSAHFFSLSQGGEAEPLLLRRHLPPLSVTLGPRPHDTEQLRRLFALAGCSPYAFSSLSPPFHTQFRCQGLHTRKPTLG